MLPLWCTTDSGSEATAPRRHLQANITGPLASHRNWCEKALEDENTRLKRLLADAMLDNAALKDLVGKKW